MASKRELRTLKISAVPWRPGIITAGQRTSTPELSMWKCVNASGSLDGMIQMRPARDQWGQTIMAPDPDATGATDGLQVLADFLAGTQGFVETDASSATITATGSEGELKTTVGEGTSNETYTLSYSATLSANTTWALRLMLRCTNFQAYGDTTNANTFVFRGQGVAGSGKEFAVWSGGLYYKQASDNKYVLITDTDFVGNGAWNAIEVRCDSTGSTLVYVNDVLVQTLTSSALAVASFTSATSAFEFEWEVEGQAAAETQYSTAISTPMFNDTDDTPFEAVNIVALTEFQYLTSSDTKVRNWLMAAGDYIYHDQGLQGGWRPLHAKQNRHVYFAPYRTSIAWTDNNGASLSSVWLWDGKSDPELMDDAPPVRFLVEHQKRLCGWGDITNPRRWYYSGDRRPKVWYSPSPTNVEDEFDVVLDAGYVEIESFGREIRGAWGDYHGLAIIAAEKGYWKLAGHGLFSYEMKGIKVGTGTANAQSVAQVGNDMWIGGAQGITSLSATEQFGDLQANYPSIPIQDLWTPTESSDDAINQTFIDQMRIVYSATKATVYIGVPHITDQRALKLYEYNTNTQKFYGPHDIDANAIAVGELASPVTEVVMVGGSDGKASYLNQFAHRDYRTEDGRYGMEIQTAALNGRSLDPALMSIQKDWKVFRLLLLPRADQDFTVTWWTDTDPEEKTNTFAQNPGGDNRLYSLDRDLRIDIDPDARLQSGGGLVTQEIQLDIRGRDCTVNIQSDYNMVIQGWEIEAVPIGYESDD